MSLPLLTLLTFAGAALAVLGVFSVVMDLFLRDRVRVNQRIEEEFQARPQATRARRSPVFKNLERFAEAEGRKSWHDFRERFINLVEQYGVFRRFARSWPMENGNLAIPVKTTGLSVAAVGESDATPTSDPAFSNINLTAKEFAVLHTLALDAAKVVSTEDILSRVWGAEFEGEPQVVYVNIRWLREKIEADPNSPTRIVNVRGVGYKLVPHGSRDIED